MAIKNTLTNVWGGLMAPHTRYSVHVADIYKAFMPDQMHLLFENAPEKHKSILLHLKMIGREKGHEYFDAHPNIAKRFLMDPDLMTESMRKGELMHASPSIMYTEFPMTEDDHGEPLKTFFGAVITDYLLTEKLDRHCRTKFAMGGYFDRRHQFTVERLMIPQTFHDPRSNQKWLIKSDIHEASIQGALHYARLCVTQMFARKEFTPEDNFKRSLRQISAAQKLEIHTRTEPKLKFGPK